MSLYTKYRPQTFDDVAGQSDAVKYLENIIKSDKQSASIPHAYLFAGTHGVGKTTLARIFARGLGTYEADIYELDAASSSRKIDDMRDIIESVYTMPVMSKYKVYILDEAHMLTKDSSNAFLKILEEPPSHVIFILCTTDPNRLISTVRSRCNIITLSSPNQKELEERLTHILKSEAIELGADVLEYISLHANSSYRDSITNLEKILHTYTDKVANNNLKLSDIENIFGRRSVDVYVELFNILASVNKEKKIAAIMDYVSRSHSLFSYDRFLECFRNAILIRNKVAVQDAECEKGEYREMVMKLTPLFTSANLLYFLAKSDLYESVSDKHSALMAILGSYAEEH